MWFLVAFMDAVPGPGTFIVFVCLNISPVHHNLLIGGY